MRHPAQDRFREAPALADCAVPGALAAVVVGAITIEILPVRQLAVGQPLDQRGGGRNEQHVLEPGVVALRTAPRQVLVEPARRHPGVEMRVEHDGSPALGPARRDESRIRQEQVVVDERAVPVVAARRAADVPHRRRQQRDRAGGKQRVMLVAGVERHPHQSELVERLGEERRCARLEQHSLQERREPPPRERIAEHRAAEGEPGLGLRQHAARPRSDDRECNVLAKAQLAVARHGRCQAPARPAHLRR